MAIQKRSSARGSPKPAASTKTSTARKAKPVKALTLRLARFVTEYMTDFSGRHAAIRAGYSAKTADQAASRMLRMPAVKAALNAKKATAKETLHQTTISNMELTVERTRLEIARIAYFDPRKMFAADGRPLAITELDDDTAAVIAGLDVLEEFEGSGQDRVLIGHVKKWKLADKNAALDKASKILGQYEKDNEQKKPEFSEQLAAFMSGIHDAGAGKLPMTPQRARK